MYNHLLKGFYMAAVENDYYFTCNACLSLEYSDILSYMLNVKICIVYTLGSPLNYSKLFSLKFHVTASESICVYLPTRH